MGDRLNASDHDLACRGQPGRHAGDVFEHQQLIRRQSREAIFATAGWCLMPAGRRGKPTTPVDPANRVMLATVSASSTVSRSLSETTRSEEHTLNSSHPSISYAVFC